MNDDWRSNPRLAGMDRSMMDMLQNLQLMNQPADGEKEDSHE